MKRILSIFLSLIFITNIAGAVDLSVYAKETEFSSFLINPIYEDAVDKQTLIKETEELEKQSQTDNDNTIIAERKSANYATPLQASQTLRDHMVKRESKIKVTFLSGTISSKKAAENVFYNALDQEISVSAEDGDYLKWHWQSVNFQVGWQSVQDKYLYTILYTVTYPTTYDQEQKVTKQIKDDSKKLNLTGKSNYKKALAIHDYVCNKIKYDYDHVNDTEYINQYTAYGGLFTGVAVCQSYATLYYRLCYENNVKCRVVTSANHAWNLVNIDGANYYVDCTWDDTKTDDVNSNTGNYWSNEIVYDYFLCGTNTLDDYMHILESDYKTEDFQNKYPISSETYVCPHDKTVWTIPQGSNCSAGFVRDLECDNCAEKMGEGEVPPNTKHIDLTTTVKATCTSGGYTLHKCQNCAYSYKSDIKKALGHSYKNNITQATSSKAGSIVNKCTRCNTVKSTTAIPKISAINLSTTTYTYNGKVRTPAVTVKDAKGKVLKKNTDYTVTYAKGRKAVGKYSVTIKFKGNYSATATKTFTIKPKSTSITKLTAGKKKFTVKWKKLTSQTTGYQIQYSTSSKFKSAKTVTVSKNKTTSKSISKLKAKKKYYVRIRTYKTVKVNGKNTKIYSSWSKAKTVTTKK
ncbi:MAG: fibronectin type III domain-containing protein [Acetobacter sp.]|nr:fibronectin type III domain-containing protein [Bacteroides sp.]MCM1341119.1 fibronectin type III domain-containing protein [Acetobacter sp.]MCM1433547.1 fibronectin type III domain-containing protein [Clostridiales bacterium]